MGSLLSTLIWPETQSPANDKFKSGGIGNKPEVKKSASSQPPPNRNQQQRKRPKGKLNKDMIGKPANFQVSLFEIDFSILLIWERLR
jgi:hypothetical protein